MKKLAIYLFLRSRIGKTIMGIMLGLCVLAPIVVIFNVYPAEHKEGKRALVIELPKPKAPEPIRLVAPESIPLVAPTPFPAEIDVKPEDLKTIKPQLVETPPDHRDILAAEFPPLYKITPTYIHLDYKFIDGRLAGQTYRELQGGSRHYKRSEIDERILSEIKEYRKVREEKIGHDLIIYMSSMPE